jgi:hypothetical protein
MANCAKVKSPNDCMQVSVSSVCMEKPVGKRYTIVNGRKMSLALTVERDSSLSRGLTEKPPFIADVAYCRISPRSGRPARGPCVVLYE